MDVLDLAKEWLRLDQEPSTRAEIQALIANDNIQELESRLRTRISFGTAGLRARMEAGFSRMNCLTVIQASQGLAQYLLDSLSPTARKAVVIGHDARHNSNRFAELTAAAFTAKGFYVNLYDGLVHTPLVPFSVVRLGFSAGIMITASHNPKEDNGYKVYNAQGCQINTPVDAAIAASILQNLEPCTWDTTIVPPPRTTVKDMETRYYSEVARLVISPMNSMTLPRFVYTPLHGVGWHFMAGALGEVIKRHSYSQGPASNVDVSNLMVVVHEQKLPDPEFPTLKFPNPEEAGALDMAMITADAHNIKNILANDPDADRFAAAEKVGEEWKLFTGDQIGVLLGYHAWRKTPSATRPRMFTTAVSSQMLARMGLVEGFDVEECLTGFKWLGSRALKNPEIACFAYEEALGYMTPTIVHDKDGVSAAILFLELYSQLGSPWKVLQSLYEKYGYFVTLNTYWKSSNAATIAKVFDEIRQYSQARMEATPRIGCEFRYRDLMTGFDSSTASQRSELPSSADAQMITMWYSEPALSRGARMTIRASGTEPKIKVYIECYGSDAHSAHGACLAVLRFAKIRWFTSSDFVMDAKYEAVFDKMSIAEDASGETFWDLPSEETLKAVH